MKAVAQTTTPWNSVKRWLPGVLISVVVFWFLLHNISWPKVWAALTLISPLSIVAVIILYFISLGARVLCWQTLLQRKVPFKRAFFVMGEGYLLNNVFPLRVGELGRAVLLSREKGLGFFQVLPTILVERAYDMAIAASLLLGTLPFVLAMKSSKTLAVAILILVVGGLVALYAMARYRTQVEALAAKIGARWPFFTKWVLPQVEAILDGFAVLTRPEYFAISLGMMVVSWGLALVEDYILLHSMVPTGPIWLVGFVLAAGALGAAVPSAPAGLGVFEGAAVFALSLVGVEYEKAFAFAICAHLISLIFSSLVGVVGLTLEGENITSLYQSLVNRKK
jgi:uncharacterized protein (TIRG00374 family)